jgi:GNAT superfamily N-acetyltransferase
MIRVVEPEDKLALIALAEATGLFGPAQRDELEGMLSAYFDGSLGDGHTWIASYDGGIDAAAYFAPEMMTEGTWNLYFIGVHPDRQGNGLGSALLRHIEQWLRERGERMLLVETSGVDGFEQTRDFYRKNSYEEEARIRDFYSAGDDKVVFRKLLGVAGNESLAA